MCYTGTYAGKQLDNRVHSTNYSFTKVQKYSSNGYFFY